MLSKSTSNSQQLNDTAAQKTLYSWRSIHPNAVHHYVRDVQQANTLVGLLDGPVGFDLEWKPTFRKGAPENPVALIQLANEESILLIQVSAMPEFPAKLREFLESPDSVKVGVGIQNDVKKLYKDHRVSTRSCVDLSLLARTVDNERWKGAYRSPIGLARLVEAYEDRQLSKGKIVRSDWSSVLNSAQQEYACNDAHAGYVLYTKLIAKARSMTTIPNSVYYTFDAVRGRLCEPSGMYWSPFNPDYDPGPPPPPQIPKGEMKMSNFTIPPSVAQAGTSSALIPSILPAGHPTRNHRTQRLWSSHPKLGMNSHQSPSPHPRSVRGLSADLPSPPIAKFSSPDTDQF